jgi:hypothetical protein
VSVKNTLDTQAKTRIGEIPTGKGPVRIRVTPDDDADRVAVHIRHVDAAIVRREGHALRTLADQDHLNFPADVANLPQPGIGHSRSSWNPQQTRRSLGALASAPECD